MGGKGSSSTPVAATSTDNSSAEMMSMMMGMMGMMESMASSSQEIAMPAEIAMPEVESTTTIDWAEKQKELDAAAKADTQQAAAERKGRVSTIHSSLTDDGEDTEMNQSLLSGDSK